MGTRRETRKRCREVLEQTLTTLQTEMSRSATNGRPEQACEYVKTMLKVIEALRSL
jgi:hypothetical protein